MRAVIVDYGSGNLRSVWQAALKAAPDGMEVLVSADPDVVRSAERVIFPGQGAMPDCMSNLKKTGLEEPVREAILNKPFFAVCVGEQMLFERSQEGDVPCLGVFAGEVVRFPAGMTDAFGQRLKVPQMGWNQVRQTVAHPLWEGVPDNAWFYFVHSYYAAPTDESIVAGRTVYGVPFTAVAARDNIFAAQFHPEKSAEAGLRLYANFLRWNP